MDVNTVFEILLTSVATNRNLFQGGLKVRIRRNVTLKEKR